MRMDSEQVWDSIFLSYNKILKRLHSLGRTTKNEKEISHTDLRKAIDVMIEKHPTCRWRSQKIKSRKYFILYEKLLSDVNDKLKTELSMSDKKTAQNRQADLNAKLTEIKEYDEKIAHIANQRISIDLDDGVKVNYDKFKDILAKIK